MFGDLTYCIYCPRSKSSHYVYNILLFVLLRLTDYERLSVDVVPVLVLVHPEVRRGDTFVEVAFQREVVASRRPLLYTMSFH